MREFSMKNSISSRLKNNPLQPFPLPLGPPLANRLAESSYFATLIKRRKKRITKRNDFNENHIYLFIIKKIRHLHDIYKLPIF